MTPHKQSLNQWATSGVCKILLGILATVSVHALAVAPTAAQKLEFEGYIAPIYEVTAQLPSLGTWVNFHRLNGYIQAGILGYTVPKKVVGNGGLFVAHGIILQRFSTEVVRHGLVYRFNGDGSYWVVVRSDSLQRPKIIRAAEYATNLTSTLKGFIVETVGENAIRKWKTAGNGGMIKWKTLSEPTLQEALDTYNDRVFFDPLGGVPLDIEAGDPSLRPIGAIDVEGIEIELDHLDLLDLEAEVALRRTMILNRLVQWQRELTPGSSFSNILKTHRTRLFNLEPVEVNAEYGALKDALPRGGDYGFPPGCPGE